MTVEPEHTNFGGVTHGGVVFAFADVSLSPASNWAVSSLAIDAHIAMTGRSVPG